MKKIILLVIAYTLFSISYSQTTVNGNQSGTWTSSGSPYEVTGDVTVPNGQVLIINAGVEINFQGHYKFNVDGQLLVNGTEGDLVLFTTDDIATGWGGIRFDTVDEISIFNYCKIENGKATGNYPDMHGGAVLLKESDAEFYNCIFENNKAIGSGDDGMGGAIYGINTGSSTETLTKFVDCLFKDNQSVTEGGAIKLTNDGHTAFTRCEFINNNATYGGGAIMFYSALDVNLVNCLFYMNSASNSGGGAIKTLNPSVSLFFTNCTFAYNSAFGSGEGGAVALDYADATFVNSIIYGNSQTYGDEINIGMNASATINYCNVDMPDDATGSNNLNNIDPLFINIGAADFHLQETSPCINAGTDVGLSYNGSAPDLGCYEYGETTQINETNLVNVVFYPNPTSDFIFYKGITNPIKIKVYTILGKEVFVKRIETNIIDVSNLNDGTYFIKTWMNDKTIKVSKIIIKR
jgi:hypothetical protein